MIKLIHLSLEYRNNGILRFERLHQCFIEEKHLKKIYKNDRLPLKIVTPLFLRSGKKAGLEKPFLHSIIVEYPRC